MSLSLFAPLILMSTYDTPTSRSVRNVQVGLLVIAACSLPSFYGWFVFIRWIWQILTH